MADNVCLDAALSYAARGWPVLPCSPEHKRPLVASDKDAEGKSIRGTGGLSKASVDPDQIRAWWAKWPKAMVAVATGHDRSFVIDFDPRTDDATGEEWTLEGLKAALVEQMSCDLPQSLTARTQSGGVHVWLRWPEGGEPIRNRGNLPLHVDVRGLGGYVVMPPSVMKTGHKYRWLKDRGPGEIAIADAPVALLEILRSKGPSALPRQQADPASPFESDAIGLPRGSDGPATPSGRETSPHRAQGDAQDAARRSYVLRAFDAEVSGVASAVPGTRNQALFDAGLKLGSLVATGYLGRETAVGALEAVARGWSDFDKSQATIANGIEAGLGNPRDLSEVGVAAARAQDWRSNAPHRSGTRPPEGGGRDGSAPRSGSAFRPSGPSAAAARGRSQSSSTVPDWKDGLDPAQWTVLRRASHDWLRRQPVPSTADTVGSLAYRAGQRFEDSLLDGVVCWLLLHGLTGIDGVTAEDVRRSFEAGQARGFDGSRLLTDMHCAGLPMTDLGNAERFVKRFGQDFRFTTAKGWMGWDGRRWAVLDQEQDSTPAEVQAAVFRTVRAIQDEARIVELSGFKGRDEGGLDYIWKMTKTSVTMFSDALGAYGRASEASGKMGCIPGLAKRWLTVSIEDFDADPFAINGENGTLLLRRAKRDDGSWSVSAQLVDHDREMLISKLAQVVLDAEADAPIYDAMVAWAQPDPAMRRYLHQWGGYSASGHVGAQILHFWYGKGANGKSTLIDAWAGALGDYSGTIGIETFLDQGIKKRGDAATPDLARLGGVRLLRASEPERGAKLNEALIKAATGGEPMAVRALHRGFFDLRPAFKLTMSGNSKPNVPGTDEGIWRRIKLVPWDSFLAPGERDEDMPNKLKAEYPGIMARIVRGLLDWLENGFVEPQAVTEATEDYRSSSDPLARFLSLCTVREAGARTQSSKLHAVFAAWCKAVGEKEWSSKGFAGAMEDKGWSRKTSNGVQWLDLKLIRDVGDFVDGEGKVRDLSEMADGSAAAGVTPSQAGAADDGSMFDGGPPAWADDDPGPDWASDPFG